MPNFLASKASDKVAVPAKISITTICSQVHRKFEGLIFFGKRNFEAPIQNSCDALSMSGLGAGHPDLLLRLGIPRALTMALLLPTNVQTSHTLSIVLMVTPFPAVLETDPLIAGRHGNTIVKQFEATFLGTFALALLAPVDLDFDWGILIIIVSSFDTV